MASLRTRFFSPTRRFSPRAIDTLRFDARKRSLAGVMLGASIEALRPFGPADDYHRSGDLLELSYWSLGVCFAFWGGALESFTCVFSPAHAALRDARKYQSSTLEWIPSTGAQARLTTESREAEVAELFGRPSTKHPEEDGIGLIFLNDGLKVYVSLGGTPRRLLDLWVGPDGEDAAGS